MVGFYFWLGLLISNAALGVRAFTGSKREQFWLGVYAASVRSLALVPLGLMLIASYFPRLTGPLPWLGSVVLIALAIMPIASFSAIWQAYQGTLNAPAVDEERAARPFDTWLPVAIVDAISLVVALVALLLSHPWN